ncbi:MAG: hypothetical protein V1816_20965 [Pseudomonadota bacterium]
MEPEEADGFFAKASGGCHGIFTPMVQTPNPKGPDRPTRGKGIWNYENSAFRIEKTEAGLYMET